MNAASIPQLVRQIRALLKQKETEGQGPRLAQEFAAVCQGVNRRLTHCEVMLNQGSDYQALQHAESTPALFTVLAQIGFKELRRWRTLCEQRQWAIPTLPDAAIIHRLHELYARSGSEEQRQNRQQLVNACRAALVQGNDDAALPLLRLLLPLDPGDSETIANLRGAEDRILRVRLQDLAEGLPHDPPEVTLSRLEELENLGLYPRTAEGMATWRDAQLMRLKARAAGLPALRAAEDWAGVLNLIGQVRGLAVEHALTPPPEDQRLIGELESWAVGKQNAFESDQEFARTLSELEFLIDQCEQRQTSLQGLSLTALRTEADALDRKWRETVRLGRALPDGLEQRHAQVAAQLRSEIRAKSRQQRNFVIAFSGTAVVVLLVVGILFVRHRTANSAAEFLRAEVSRRQPLALSNLLAGMLREHASLARRPPLQGAIAEANAFIVQATRQAETVIADLATLRQQLDLLAEDLPASEWVRFQAQMDAASSALTNLTTDLRPSAQEPYRELASKWEAYLSRRRQERTQSFRQRLEAALAMAQEGLSYSRGAPAVSETVDRLRPAVSVLRGETNPPLPAVALPDDLLLQFEDLDGRCLRFAQAAEHSQATVSRIAAAPNLDPLLDALRAFLTNPFSPPAHCNLAESALQADFSTNRLYSGILFRGRSDLWKAFLVGTELKLHPGELNPDERSLLKVLSEDTSIHKTGRYPFRSSGEPERFLYINVTRGNGLTPSADGRAYTALVYDPQKHPLKVVWETRSFAKWQLPDKGREDVISESLIYANSGLAALSPGDSRTNSLLEVMDRLRLGTNAPIFRAYALLQLGKLTDSRPMEWGVPWCPAFTEHREQLRQMVGDADLHEAWLRPGPQASPGGEIASFLARTSTVRYQRQATFLHKLAVLTARAGWTFCGHAGFAPGVHSILPIAQGRDLYGWESPTNPPARIYRWSAEVQRHERIRTPFPLSPLYSPGETPRRLIQAAEADSFSISASEPSVQPWLPPFFTEP